MLTSCIDATGQPDPEPLFYGMPISGVKPIQPPLDSFQWAQAEYATCGPDDLLDHLIPPPCPPAPDGYSYPLAPPKFSLVPDHRYRRGFAYFSNFRLADKTLLRQRLLCTINPPNIEPKLCGQDYIAEPLAGMIQMPLSVPFIQRLDGDPLNTVTCAVAHSSASLEMFGIKPEVQKLEQQLYTLAFGSNPRRTDQPSIRALCSLGLKPNDRSAKNLGKDSRTGSSSLGATVGKGEGRGVFLPAVQTATPEASLLIGDALKIIHKLQQLIMPCSLSKFEYEMSKWYMTENNVFVTGGLGPGATSVQQNVADRGKGSLADKIGFVQGNWHTDPMDAFVYFTFGILMLKLPPGSDPGPFMFGRCGLYVRETGVLILYLVFRGNDLHSGYSPSSDGTRLKEWLDLESLEALVDLISPENRIFFVAYPSEVGMSRVASVSVVPPVFFMNQGAPVSHKLRQKNFAQHGATVLGDAHARANRLGREIWWGAFNAFKVAGLKLDMSPDELFALTKYRDEKNEFRALDPPPINIERDADSVRLMRGYFAWYRIQSEKYLIRISRSAYFWSCN
ncbi:hypothetical protein C8R47DRAFT_398636 [Mycena vitilis]|nr:hypothetical protein C8R47DRAFT_398636 [Mycena vitilis]